MEKDDVTKLGAPLVPDELTLDGLRKATKERWEKKGGPEKAVLYPVYIGLNDFPEAMEGFMPADEQILARLKHLDIGVGNEVAGVAELYVFIRPVLDPGVERVLTVTAEQRAELETCPNFVGVERYNKREPQPMEVGYLSKSVTYLCGIGHSYRREFGPVLCRVEMAE